MTERRLDNELAAYRDTHVAVTQELAFRATVSLVVALIMGAASSYVYGLCWWAVMCALLVAEVAAFRRFFSAPRATIGLGDKLRFAALSVVIASVYTVPAWVFVAKGEPWALFAAACFIAGTMIHVTLNNGATILIYAAATAPFYLSFLIAGAVISVAAGNIVAMVTVISFNWAVLSAFLTRLSVMRRLTESRQEAERQRQAAEESSEAKSRCLAKMSHELRTPLNGVLGMAAALQDSDLSATQREKLDVIVNSGDVLLEHLNDILDHAKIESETMKFDVQDEDLAAVIREATLLFTPAATRKGLDLSYDVDGLAARYLRIDRRRSHQVLTNIISNAIKFTETGSVRIKATSELGGDGEAHVTVSVTDTGIGASGADLLRLRASGQFHRPAVRRHRPRPVRGEIADRGDWRQH